MVEYSNSINLPQVSLTDIWGQIFENISIEEMGGNRILISLNNLSSGIYFLNLKFENNTFIEKVSVVK
jgi:hypothetical protein